MKNKNGISEDNLVMFPASKNFPIIATEEGLGDPLQDLLDEFSDLEIDLDEDYEDLESIELENDYQSLLARGKQCLISEKILLLKDTQKRIKYLLEEIELYLPRK